MPAGEGVVARGRHKRDQAIIILLFYVHSGSKLLYPILKRFSSAVYVQVYAYTQMWGNYAARS